MVIVYLELMRRRRDRNRSLQILERILVSRLSCLTRPPRRTRDSTQDDHPCFYNCVCYSALFRLFIVRYSCSQCRTLERQLRVKGNPATGPGLIRLTRRAFSIRGSLSSSQPAGFSHRRREHLSRISRVPTSASRLKAYPYVKRRE